MDKNGTALPLTIGDWQESRKRETYLNIGLWCARFLPYEKIGGELQSRRFPLRGVVIVNYDPYIWYPLFDQMAITQTFINNRVQDKII